MKEQILVYLSNREGATISWLLAEFTVYGKGRIRRRDEVFEALDELLKEGRVKREIHQTIGWIYSLPKEVTV